MARAGTIHKGGRPKGSKSPRTIERDEYLNAIKDRGAKMAQQLLGSQALIAHGTHTLMRIDETTTYRDTGRMDKKGNPVKNKYTTREFKVVTNPEEIEKVLNEFEDVDGAGVVDEKYYFVTHKEPQNQAIDSILNRTFGRPTESIEIGNKDNQPFILNLKK